jgi:hypothetical protein
MFRNIPKLFAANLRAFCGGGLDFLCLNVVTVPETFSAYHQI